MKASKLRRIPLPEPGDVAVWLASNNCNAETLKTFAMTLDAKERRHAERFRFDKDRRAYIFSHGVLRAILARYVGIAPLEIEMTENAFGKPFLNAPTLQSELMFNMSHSKDMVLVAITRRRRIGVDIEFIRSIDDIESIAAHYFTNPEHDLVKNASQKDCAFYTCWTRKEAFIKAVGKGLSIPLNSFDTFIPVGASGRELLATEDAPDIPQWWLCDLQVREGYAAALVIEGLSPAITLCDWNEYIAASI